MIESNRTLVPGGARHAIAFPEAGVNHIVYGWPDGIGDALGRRIIDLMRHTTASAPIIGFAEEISDGDAEAYLGDLRAHLASNKCRLLTITADSGLLIGLCTLRRNLNPNNCHITDLAKGMIREEFRGGLVLPAAFYEIALKCQADGVDVVTLDVRAGTPAHRAWERFGFQTWGVLPDYARAQGTVHAGHFMLQRVADLRQRAVEAAAARMRTLATAEAATA
ncbi:MAG: GNAT family N-acetyltransferase [Rhizobacter sp.]